MDPHLQKLQREIASAVAGMSAEQLCAHAPGKWCASEILEHLYLTYTGTLKGFQRVEEAGKPLAAASPTWRNRMRTLVVVGLGLLPSGRESPAAVRPRGVPLDTVLAEIAPKIVEMDNTIARCEETFGSRRRLLDHPILGPLTAGQWRKFHLVHGRHHVRQILRLRQA